MGGPVVYLLTRSAYGLPVIILLIMLGMTGAMRNPVSEAYILNHTPARRRSTVLGVYYFGNMESPGLVMPLVGYMVDHLGFLKGYTIIATALFVSSLVFLFTFWGRRD